MSHPPFAQLQDQAGNLSFWAFGAAPRACSFTGAMSRQLSGRFQDRAPFEESRRIIGIHGSLGRHDSHVDVRSKSAKKEV
ncbi:hypothetical protein CU100_18040 [Phyllobacterium endophyticum]|uniref:Uncharacterized protein n=1 Tax=Phyllobacterium endophyticum TaxID=1149773 RepID=A0A2P7ASE3_9HYPH|nr:hypothetical protein CU100_18040 [Phyllobacterium endophyticum]